jgi:hypothetical protein
MIVGAVHVADRGTIGEFPVRSLPELLRLRRCC